MTGADTLVTQRSDEGTLLGGHLPAIGTYHYATAHMVEWGMLDISPK
jgi:hypothetical protein